MECTICHTPLNNDLDTYGDIHQPLCKECFFNGPDPVTELDKLQDILDDLESDLEDAQGEVRSAEDALSEAEEMVTELENEIKKVEDKMHMIHLKGYSDRVDPAKLNNWIRANA